MNRMRRDNTGIQFDMTHWQTRTNKQGDRYTQTDALTQTLAHTRDEHNQSRTHTDTHTIPREKVHGHRANKPRRRGSRTWCVTQATTWFHRRWRSLWRELNPALVLAVGAGSPFVGMFVADEDGCPTGVNNALKGKHAPSSLKIGNTRNYWSQMSEMNFPLSPQWPDLGGGRWQPTGRHVVCRWRWMVDLGHRAHLLCFVTLRAQMNLAPIPMPYKSTCHRIAHAQLSMYSH